MNLITLALGRENSSHMAYLNDNPETLFSIASFTAKSQSKLLKNPEMLELFNRFVEHYKLNDRIETVYKQMWKELSKGADIQKAGYYMRELLSYMDITVIKEFILREGMTAPDRLKETFNMDNEKNAIESRDQTYLKSEFIDLMTIVIASKVLIPLTDMLIKQYTHEALFIILKRGYKEFTQTEPMLRLERFITSHIDKTSGGEENRMRVSTMVENIGSTEVTEYVLGTLLFKTFPTYATIKNPPSHSNIIGGMYYLVSNIFNSNKKSEHKFTVKGPSSTGDADSEQSIFETYRQATPYSPGKVEVMRKQYRDITRLAKDFGIKDMSLVEKFLKMAEPMFDSTHILHPFTVNLLKLTMTKRILGLPYDSPLAYPVLEREQVVNMAVVFAAYAIENGHAPMAKYMLMSVDTTYTIGKGRITKPIRLYSVKRELVEELSNEYRVYVKKSKDDKITEVINAMTDSINLGHYTYLLEEPYRDVQEDYMGQTPDVRNDFARYIKHIKEI